MKKIILIEPDSSLQTILKLNFMHALGVQVETASSAEDAINCLQKEKFALAVCREYIGDEETAIAINTHLQDHHINTKLLVMGNSSQVFECKIKLKNAESWKEIIRESARLLNLPVIQGLNEDLLDYVPVNAHYFLNIDTSLMGCDIYIKIKKHQQEDQYVKRVKNYEHFAPAEVERYINIGLKHFYITKNHFYQFVNFSTEQLIAKLKSETSNSTDKIQLNSDTYEITREHLQTLGISPQTEVLVQESLKSMSKSIQEAHALNHFFNQLLSNKLSYAYAHSHLSALILTQIVAQFDWNSPQIKEKITYLCYFHDISLTDGKLARITSIQDLQECNYTEEDKTKIYNHASESAEMLGKFTCIPFDIAALVREHHGNKNGKGFSETLNLKISPLCMMFIVAEDFTGQFLNITETPTKENLDKILNRLQKIYNKGTYAQAIGALRLTISKAHKFAA